MLLSYLRPGILLFFVFYVGSVQLTAAQVHIEGVVIDTSSNEALPGASIQLENTYSGTITNGSGNFSLLIPSLPAVLVVRFIGYQSARVEVPATHSGILRIKLAASTLSLPGITISGEDMGIQVMRKVIEEKVKWRKTLSTYSVKAYNRFRMENESGIVSIWESGTKAFWDINRGVREILLWQNQTQNMNMSDVLPAALFIMNLYDDDVEVAGHSLMGVTHPKALSFYDFKLESMTARDDREVYIISVAPKQKTSNGFVGRVSVLDGEFALLSAELRPGEAFLFPPPIQYVNVSYNQQFSNFGTDVWLPLDFKADMDVKVGIGGVLVFPEFKIRQLSSLTDFEINVPVPDSLYAKRRVVVKDSMAQKMDALQVERIGVPLTEEEILAYRNIDSTMTIEKAFKPKGILARYVSTGSSNRGSRITISGGNPGSRGRLSYDVRPEAWLNRVEGVHLAANTSISPSKRWEILGKVGYSTAQKEALWGIGAELKNTVSVRFWYSDETLAQYRSDIRNPLSNSFTVLSGAVDYFDYYSKRGWTISAKANGPKRRRISGTLLLGSESHESLTQQSFKSFLGTKLETRVNSPVAEGQLHFAGIILEGNFEDLPIPVGPQKRWKLSLERGLGGSALSGGHYNRYEGLFLWRIPTFFKRRLLSNALEIRLLVGTINGSSIPTQKLGIVDGSSSFTSFGSIKTLATAPYRGSSWGLVAWEHTFRTVPFELIGWDWAVKRHWSVIIHGAHGKTTLKRPKDGVVTSHGVHQEVGVSLSGLFTLIRIDTAWRLDQKDFRVGIAVARLF